MSKCLISCEGGLGKNIMFTSILSYIKQEYDELYVVSPYSDVFKCCPEVTDAFPMGQSALYESLALDADCDILWREPYSNGDFIKKRCHLFTAWLHECGLQVDGLKEGPSELIPNLEVGNVFFNIAAKARDEAKKLGKFMMVQFSGGQSPLMYRPDFQYNWYTENLKRHYYKAQELINLLHKKYPNYTIVQYRLPNEPLFEGVTYLGNNPYLFYRELAKYATKVVAIDSSLQHMVTGVCEDVTIIWGETQPEHFGYAVNKNIKSTGVRNTEPYFKPLGVSPAIVRFPSPEEVLAKVEEK